MNTKAFLAPRRLFLIGVAALLPMAVSNTAPAQQQQDYFDIEKRASTAWSFSAGLDYSNGDYGSDSETEIWYAPVSAEMVVGNLRLRATVPWIAVEGTGDVVGGTAGPIVRRHGDGMGGGMTPPPPPPTPQPDPIVTAQSGVGDIVLQAGYSFGGGALPWVEIIGKVKLPTASASQNLGSGKTDLSVQADFWQSLGAVTPFATIGYKVFGDPEGIALKNTPFASAGASLAIAPRTSFGAALDWRAATLAGAQDLLELSPFVTFALTERWILTGYGVLGLKDGSPDGGAGLTLRLRL
ncbi:MAG: transporter [Pseudomonadota bacterium]